MLTDLAECLAAEGMDLHVLCSRGHFLLRPMTRRGQPVCEGVIVPKSERSVDGRVH